ncbi:MAG: hypothetical protein GX410_06765 [Elusimicrobia bacterium]|nr:hypothetical protein [Elusimicrobiota bacterium]
MSMEKQSGLRAFIAAYRFYFLAPIALLLATLLALYAVYGPKLFVAFLYAGM